MYRKNRFSSLIVVIIVLLVLCSCDKNVNIKNNAASQTNSVTEYTSDTINKDCEGFQEILKDLNIYLSDIKDVKSSKEDRLKKVALFNEGLKRLLTMNESISIDDNEFEAAIESSVVSKTKSITQNGINIKVRVVRYDGFAELHGTLERIWVYIQTWDGDKLSVQSVIQNGAEIVDDFILLKIKDKLTILMTGYLTLYKPNPIFAAAWQFTNNEWNKFNIFNSSIISDNYWSIKVFGNELIVESTERVKITKEINLQNNSLIIYPEIDDSKKVVFMFSEEQIIKN